MPRAPMTPCRPLPPRTRRGLATALVATQMLLWSLASTQALGAQPATSRDAGTVATKASVQRLIIGHFSARYRDLALLLEEARAIFPDTDLALEGLTFDLRKDE